MSKTQTCIRNSYCATLHILMSRVLYMCLCCEPFQVPPSTRNSAYCIVQDGVATRCARVNNWSIWMHLGFTKVSRKHQTYPPFHARLCFHCVSLGQSHFALLVQHFVSWVRLSFRVVRGSQHLCPRMPSCLMLEDCFSPSNSSSDHVTTSKCNSATLSRLSSCIVRGSWPTGRNIIERHRNGQFNMPVRTTTPTWKESWEPGFQSAHAARTPCSGGFIQMTFCSAKNVAVEFQPVWCLAISGAGSP